MMTVQDSAEEVPVVSEAGRRQLRYACRWRGGYPRFVLCTVCRSTHQHLLRRSVQPVRRVDRYVS